MLSFLSFFPKGILVRHYVTFVREFGMMEHRPIHWAVPLINLKLLRPGIDPQEIKNFKEKNENEIARMEMEGFNTIESILERFLDFRLEDDLDLLYIKKDNVGSTTELVLMVNYQVRNVLEEMAEESLALKLIYSGLTNAISFHRIFLHLAIGSLKINCASSYQEELVEATQIGEGYLQRRTSGGLPKYQEDSSVLSYFDIAKCNKVEFEELFNHYITSYTELFCSTHRYQFCNVLKYILYFFRSSLDEEMATPIEEEYGWGMKIEDQLSSCSKKELKPESRIFAESYGRVLTDTIIKVLTMTKILSRYELVKDLDDTAQMIRDSLLELGVHDFCLLGFQVSHFVAQFYLNQILKGQDHSRLNENIYNAISSVEQMKVSASKLPSSEDFELE